MPRLYGSASELKINKSNNNAMTNNLFYGQNLYLQSQKNDVCFSTFDDVMCWIDGECYNLHDLSRNYNLSARSLSDFIIRSYLKNCLEEFLEEADGYFSVVLYDKKKDIIKLISDRYGMRLLYWYSDDDNFIWSSQVGKIACQSTLSHEFDTKMFSCFFDLGYLVGNRTYFNRIKLLEPSEILTYHISEKLISRSKYWSWSRIKNDEDITFDQAVDKIGNFFIESVKNRVNPNERVGVALSGGLDSRAIIAALKKIYPDYTTTTYTFGIKNCEDIKIAKEVSKLTNHTHKIFHFSKKNWYFPRFERIWKTDGMQDMQHMHGSEFLESISKAVDINLNGYAGDAVLGGSLLKESLLDQRANINNIEYLYSKYSDLSGLESSFYDINHIEPVIYMNRVRRFTNMGSVNALGKIGQRKPFFSNKIIETVFSIPDEWRFNNKLYSAMLLRFFPDFFSDIAWQKTGLTLKGEKPRQGLFERISNKMRPPSKNYMIYARMIREPSVQNSLRELLGNKNALYRGVLDVDGEKILTDHLENLSINNINPILRLATIEIYLNQLKSRSL